MLTNAVFLVLSVYSSIQGSQASLLRMSNELTSAVVSLSRGQTSLLATSLSTAQCIIPVIGDSSNVHATAQVLNEREDTPAPSTRPFIQDISVVHAEFDEANQLLLMTSTQHVNSMEVKCYSLSSLSNQGTALDQIGPLSAECLESVGNTGYCYIFDALCVDSGVFDSAAAITSTLQDTESMSGATGYAAIALISRSTNGLKTLVGISNKTIPSSSSTIANATITPVGGSQEVPSKVAITSSAFDQDNSAFVAIAYVDFGQYFSIQLFQLIAGDELEFGQVSLNSVQAPPYPAISNLQLATARKNTSMFYWDVFVLVTSETSGTYSSSLYSWTVTNCAGATCPASCPTDTPCLQASGPRTLGPLVSFFATPILCVNKFSILPDIDASVVFVDAQGDVQLWETDSQNGTFPDPSNAVLVGAGPAIYSVSSNNQGGLGIAYGGAGQIHLAIRCDGPASSTFVKDTIYYEDLYGSPGFANVALSNQCDGESGVFAAAPCNEGGSLALYSSRP